MRRYLRLWRIYSHVGNDFEPSSDLPSTLTLIKVEDPYRAFAVSRTYDSMNKRPAGASTLLLLVPRLATDVTLELEWLLMKTQL